MKRYEYFVITVGLDEGHPNKETLSPLGREGWLMTGIYPFTEDIKHSGESKIAFYFAREIIAPQKLSTFQMIKRIIRRYIADRTPIDIDPNFSLMGFQSGDYKVSWRRPSYKKALNEEI